jgi:hypothetical protein
MKRWICFLLAACFVTALCGVVEARVKARSLGDPDGGASPDKLGTFQISDKYFNVLNVGALWMPHISNKGYVGYYLVSAYYPGGGDQSSVWQAGMWAGGHSWNEEEEEFYPLAWLYQGSDGRNCDGHKYDNLGLQAVVEDETDLDLPYPYKRFTVKVNTALKDTVLADRGVIDGDLGMTVTYEWHSWGVREYDNWAFIHVTIDFEKRIRDFWWGWMSDCDMGDVGLSDYWFDDYAGWNEDLEFCYMRDWDYDPVPFQPAAPSTEDSLFLTPNVFGQVLLAAPPPGGDINADPDPAQRWVTKNYWDWNNDYSTRQDAYDRLTGDWTNQFDSPTDFDYRILSAVGPYDVEPGDKAEFWMAYVIGEGYDEDSRATFHLGTLVDHVEDAHAFYNGGMVIPESAYPPRTPDLDPDLDADVMGDKLTVHWDPYTDIPPPGMEVDEFRVYKSTISKLGPWVLDQTLGSNVTSTTVDLIPGFYTYVWVEAYSDSTELGSNPYAMTSRLYEADIDGIIQADEGTIVGVIGNTVARENLDEVTVAPNPYVGTNEAELTEYETILGFHNLPKICTIYVYTLLGNLVDIIHHDSESGSEFWDMTTRTNEAIASGLYVYRVVAEDGQEKLGKFAVIKGQR